MATFPGDFGIIFQGTSGTPSTYVDVLGQTRDEVQLASLTPVRMPVDVTSAYVHAGLARRFSLFVTVEMNPGSGPIDVQMQGHYELDPAAEWTEIFQFDNTNTTGTSATVTFTASGQKLLQTSNVGAVPEMCLLVTPGDDFDGTIIAKLVALP